jgi:hypothetical protein
MLNRGCVTMLGAAALPPALFSPPPNTNKPSPRLSSINKLLPYKDSFDVDGRILAALKLLYDTITCPSSTEYQHERANNEISQLLKFKFILDDDLLRWLAMTLFEVALYSQFHVVVRSKYAGTFVKLAKKLKKAKLNLSLDGAKIVEYIKSQLLGLKSRSMFKFEEDAFIAISKVFWKCRNHLSDESRLEISKLLSSKPLLDVIQEEICIISLLCPKQAIRNYSPFLDFNRRHINHAVLEFVRVESKRLPESISKTLLQSITVKCIGYIGLKSSKKSNQLNYTPYRGKRSHHLKILCSSVFESIPVLLGDLFGNLFGRGRDDIDDFIIQFIRQFELVVYPSSGNTTLTESVLIIMQRMCMKMAKRFDRHDLSIEACSNLYSLIVKCTLRAAFEKNIIHFMICQGVIKAITHVSPTATIPQVLSLFMDMDTVDAESHRLSAILSLMSCVGSKLQIEHPLELLEIFPKVVDYIDVNHTFKALGASNFIESVTFGMTSGGQDWLTGYESDVALYLWDKIESILCTHIEVDKNELHVSDRNNIELVLSNSGRFLGLLGVDTTKLVMERIADFVCDKNGFQVRKPFKQFIMTFGRSGLCKDFTKLFNRVSECLLEKLKTSRLERPSEDHCCDVEVWLLHVLSAVTCVGGLPFKDCSSTYNQTAPALVSTKNINIAKAIGKFTKAIINSIGTVYIPRVDSRDGLCSLDDISVDWHIPSLQDAIDVSSFITQTNLIQFANPYCQSLFLKCLLGGVKHFEACLALLDGEYTKYELNTGDAINLICNKTLCLLNNRESSLEAKEIALKVRLY